MKIRLALSLCLGLCAGAAAAQTAPTLAQDGLQARIDHLSQGADANGFELGMLQTLRGVERTLQARYEFGLGQGHTNLPLLRLTFTLAPNPAPRASGPETLGRIMAQFVTDMGTARASLANAQAAGIAPFTLTLTDLWFDVNANGARDRGEDATAILGPLILGRPAFAAFEQASADAPPVIRFDAADHAWLTAYTHMLSGFGNLFLAFDPAPVLADLDAARAALADAPEIPNPYDQDALRQTLAARETLLDETRTRQRALDAEIAPLRQTVRDLRRQTNEAETTAEKDALRDRIAALDAEMRPMDEEIRALNQTVRFLRNEIASIRSKLEPTTSPRQSMIDQQRASIDALYVIYAALRQQPDAARIRAAHADWTAMIAHNRTFWDLLGQETDDDREWIPNPQQASALGLTIPAELAQGWQAILADAAAVLDGRLLVPHPLLPAGHGIDVSAYVADPAPLDLGGWVHGIAAYPFAARGPRITAQNWRAFQRLTGGNAGGFALLLN